MADLVVTFENEAPSDWEKLLVAAHSVDFYSHPLWTNVLVTHLSDWRPFWLLARRDGDLLGGLVGIRRRRGFRVQVESHYYGTSGGPIIRLDLDRWVQEDLFTKLLAALGHAGRPFPTMSRCTLSTISVRRFGDLAARSGWKVTPDEIAVIPLAQGLDFVESKVFRKNRRNERNRAIRRGCVVSTGACQRH